jgi:hypothetical protein
MKLPPLRRDAPMRKLKEGWDSLIVMRYWAYFAGKVVAVFATFYGLLALLNRTWEHEYIKVSGYKYVEIAPRFGYSLGYTLITLGIFLLFTASLYFAIWDQKYRCRVCLRRLRMPVETGSWHRMLQFGRPRIEYICTYGHGTLREDELQISGMENPEWTPHSDDLWDELCASSKEADDKP